MPRKAVATMVSAAVKCMIDEGNGNHPRLPPRLSSPRRNV
jgi:hypothetical protein